MSIFSKFFSYLKVKNSNSCMSKTSDLSLTLAQMQVCVNEHRYPFCIVWTPIPIITWMFPFIGHMGIATSEGIIRDFGGSYYVGEDDMAFGWPTLYWQLLPDKVDGGVSTYDRAIEYASEKYKSRTHNLFCDNCHCHVALALNEMNYGGRSNWNMVNVCAYTLFYGRFVGLGFLRQYAPFMTLLLILVGLLFFAHQA